MKTLPRGLVRYEPALDDELFAFQRTAYPERRVDWVEPRWRWMFLDSARRLGARPMVWLYRAKSGIVAHQGAIAVRLKLGPEEVTTGWFVETMVLESHRGKAVGPMVVKKALEDLPLNLSLGQTQQMRELQCALGWRQVAPLSVWMQLLDASRVLAGKFRGPARWLAAAALRSAQALKSIPAPRRAPLKAVRVERFDARHDALWQRASRDLECAVVRDAAYLNWKYCDQPGQDFVRLELCDDQGQAVAIVVLQIRESDDDYRYRRGMIVDLVAPLGDRPIVAAALASARRAAEQRDVDALIFACIHSGLERQLGRLGFLRREPTRFFLIAAPEAARRRMLAPENWLVTMGDSDIDRPW